MSFGEQAEAKMDNGSGRDAGATAPSTRRRDIGAWVALACVEGALVGAVALAALWRAFPALPAPEASIGAHAMCWAEQLAGRAFPALLGRHARECAAALASIGGERFAAGWRAAAASVAACIPAALTARSGLALRDGLTLLRGPARHEGRAAARRLRAKFREQAKRRPDHQIAPDVPWPSDMWTRHTLVVGGVGAGKSTFLRPLLKRVIESNERALLFDPKGEFTEAFGRPAILAPWDSRSLAWDIASDLRNTQDMRRFASTMVRESADPMWSNAARQVLVGLLLHLQAAHGRNWGWAELAELLFLSQPELLAIMRLRHPEAARAVEKASVTTQGVLINLSAFCGPIIDLASAWGEVPPNRRVSFKRWIEGRSRSRQIVLQGHGAYEELTRRCAEAVVDIVAARVRSVEMRDDSSRKLWFIADELPQAGKIPIRALFEVGRSRGVRCVVACQDFAQLEEIHGEPFVRALVSMCGTLVVGQMSPGDTAEKICKALGQREHERRNVSVSGAGPQKSNTVSYSRESVPLYSPSELASRLGPTRDGKGVKLLVVAGGDAHEIFYPIASLPRMRPAHVPAPWTLGPGREAEKQAELGDAPDLSRLPSADANVAGRGVERAALDATSAGPAASMDDKTIADLLAATFPASDSLPGSLLPPDSSAVGGDDEHGDDSSGDGKRARRGDA
ncbi:type IV secretion system DNA-binding domain-containing protein [Burkholderia glumae]|uniref:type IV secretion system DNA-binding domain-containing protein n=1 Tax=Burkholderia glumae TaxID=337 RepID=UPI001E398155|nr:type IV secretion system DNA-binding domain-containing protein [Burkholderia glumae]